MKNIVPFSELSIADILQHAMSVHGERELVSFDADGILQRSTYLLVAKRAAQLAHALTKLGLEAGACISTFAWNDLRHVEIYFAVPSLGAICHTVNPRLFSSQLEYILHDAKSAWLMVDPQFVSTLLPFIQTLPALQGVIVLADEKAMDPLWSRARPEVKWHCYETLLQDQPEAFSWPVVDENSASGCCYTSGTTGNPKGVYYSHRSTVLHSMALALPDAASLSADDSALVVVPMFHVNGWGLPYAAAMVGAKLVLPGRFMGDGQKLQQLIESELVTVAAGVPTVWLAWLEYCHANAVALKNPLRVVIGGAPCTDRLRDALEAMGCEVRLAWGMTETSPVGTVSRPVKNLSTAQRLSPGRPVFGVQLRLIDDAGNPLSANFASVGELQIRGPWIARGYLNQADRSEFTADGWFSTGDVAYIDRQGYLHITDRAKDVIKSGGEWISSQLLENIASSHPAVAAAAVVAIAHPQWDERPMLLVVARPQQGIDEDELLQWFDGKIAKWWKPDVVKVIDHLPMTATGKINKKELREMYAMVGS